MPQLAVQYEGCRCNSVGSFSTERREGNKDMKGNGGTMGKQGLTALAVARIYKEHNQHKRTNDSLGRRHSSQLTAAVSKKRGHWIHLHRNRWSPYELRQETANKKCQTRFIPTVCPSPLKAFLDTWLSRMFPVVYEYRVPFLFTSQGATKSTAPTFYTEPRGCKYIAFSN
jgi:hypothetical protein